MIYKEWLESDERIKMVGNARFDFKKLDDETCLLKVSCIGANYNHVELQHLELQNWFNACCIIPEIVAFDIFNNL